MNYGLTLSLRMEQIIRELQPIEKANPAIADEEELPLEERALRRAVDETNGQAWASNARSIRIGEIILLVDSDTQVPDDCFRDAARELAECPEVAIIQHESDVLQVAHHWFEVSASFVVIGYVSAEFERRLVRMAWRISHAALITVSAPPLPMVKLRRSLVTMRAYKLVLIACLQLMFILASCAGPLSKKPPSTMKMTVTSSSSGASRMYQKISI